MASETALIDALEADVSRLSTEHVGAWIESHGWTRFPTAGENTLRAWAQPSGADSIHGVVSLALSRNDSWYARMIALSIGRVAVEAGIGLVQALRELDVIEQSK